MGAVTDPRIFGNRIALGQSGFYDFDAPARSEFTLDDLILGMSRINRFSGQLGFSVLQHSVNVSFCAAEMGASIAEQRQALFHDAHEALVGDTVRPLWRKLHEIGQQAGLLELETQARELLAERFRFEPITFPIVQRADDHVLALETRDGFYVDPATWGTPLLPGGPLNLLWQRQDYGNDLQLRRSFRSFEEYTGG